MRQMAAGAKNICMITLDPPEFRHLTDHPEKLPILAQWFIEEWAPWYGPGGAGDAQQDLLDCDSRDRLPICLIALNADEELLGAIALRDTSVGSELGYGPWLAGLLVTPPHRGKGVGTALVAALEREAARLGFDAIYTSTDTAEGIMRRRGWQPVGAATSLRGEVEVFRRALDGRAM